MGKGSGEKAIGVINAAAVILPIVEALIGVAERASNGEARGEDKHNAVAEATGLVYEAVRATGSVKEIKDIPFADVQPLVTQTGGLIGGIVSIFNRLGRFFKRKD